MKVTVIKSVIGAFEMVPKVLENVPEESEIGGRIGIFKQPYCSDQAQY